MSTKKRTPSNLRKTVRINSLKNMVREIENFKDDNRENTQTIAEQRSARRTAKNENKKYKSPTPVTNISFYDEDDKKWIIQTENKPIIDRRLTMAAIRNKPKLKSINTFTIVDSPRTPGFMKSLFNRRKKGGKKTKKNRTYKKK
jgi:hypothetical protein